MRNILKAGIVLGVLVVIWQFVVGLTGWYKDPVLVNVFYLVIAIEVGVLIWGLRLTAREGKGYGAQLGAGTLMSVVGAVIIFVGAILTTAVVIPTYFADIQAMTEQVLREQGKTDDEIRTYIEMMAPMQTHFVNALTGAIMTVITGFVASLVIAVFVRKKEAAPPAAA